MSSFQCFLCTIVFAVFLLYFNVAGKWIESKERKERFVKGEGEVLWFKYCLSGRTGFFLILFVSMMKLDALLELDLS